MIRDFIAAYPVTLTYLAGVGTVLAISGEVVSVGTGLVVLSLLAVLIAMIFTWRELNKVHVLVNGQRDEMMRRIEQLTNMLLDAGVAVPDRPHGGRESGRERVR